MAACQSAEEKDEEVDFQVATPAVGYIRLRDGKTRVCCIDAIYGCLPTLLQVR